ncbi:MalY/PatB family protein [Demequina aurantiaca]|uniref:MalY/PatB family protein n=1 Tax=Demequina aurantiaca TaxID=676200 RepID=UPI0007815F20|nr:aminotransferase class I/II-fold pyridoxal phosphate-dependent enzyme [Demequina aurantiaca]
MTVPASPRPNPLTVPTLDALKARTSAKWGRFEPDVLPLYVAEMDVEFAPAVRDALARAVATGDVGYRTGTAYEESLVSFAAERWDWPTLAVEHIVAVPDVITGYTDAITLVTDPGDAVIINPPAYPPFFSFVKGAGRRIEESPLGADFRIDLESLEAAFQRATTGGRPAAYLLCNPHNPTGTLHTRAELEAVAALAARYGVRVVADEIHAPLVYTDASYTPYLSVAGERADAFSLMSASKAWNLAGVPAALLIAGTDSTGDLARYVSVPRHGPSQLGALAQTAAYTQGGPWLDDLVAGLDANRHLLKALLAEKLPKAGFTWPESTYLSWVDLSAYDLAGEDPSEFLHREARVMLNSGPTFGTGGAGHVRINFATSPAILTEAIDRIAHVVG